MTIDNEEDDHHEVESNIEVDGDNDNNMLCSQNFISLLPWTPKRENFASLSEAVFENRNNARYIYLSHFNKLKERVKRKIVQFKISKKTF